MYKIKNLYITYNVDNHTLYTRYTITPFLIQHYTIPLKPYITALYTVYHSTICHTPLHQRCFLKEVYTNKGM